MDENFTKFNTNILGQIHDFINSQKDLLYIGGFQGCGKSEIVNKAIENIDENTLLFRHLCFENSVIDDFLLGFYDNLRYYSINKRINLKKSLTENFAQKVSFYFKNLDKKSLIIIDNFEIISKNSEIMDFLAHLGKFENVKLILISRVLNPEFFENKGLGFEIISIEPNDYLTFKLKVQDALEIFDDADIEELYTQTKGYELYLSMTLRYISTVNTTLKEFIEEFKKRNMEFSDFLLSKIVSLVPPIYLPFLQNMSCLNHSVKIGFIEYYKLGDISLVNYLYRKLLISKFDDEIYLKDYLKQHFLSGLSVKEKINNYKNLIEIYKKELAKSPKDRLLRLSRESIRKQIEYLKTKIPNIPGISTESKKQDFSYIQQARGAGMPWYAKLANLKNKKFQSTPENTGISKKPAADPLFGEEILSEEEKVLIEEFRKNKAAKSKNTIQNQISKTPEDVLKEAEKLESEYNYTGAIEILNRLKNEDSDKKISAQLLVKLAKNYSKINNFEESIKCYLKASDISKELGDISRFADIKLQTANLYKNLYRFEKAKECLSEVIPAFSDDSTQFKNDITMPKNTIAKGYLALGEIYEMENDFKSALKNYENALSSSDTNNPDNILLSEIYFKTALLYDDGQNTEKALEYYQKSIDGIQNKKDSKENKFLSTCYANTGLIYAEKWSETGVQESFETSTENFKAALKIDTEEENQNGIYFASRQLSMLYRDNSPETSAKYMQISLDAAVKLKDDFKIALSRLELGDYYYNTMNNKLALINYFEAKKALGSNISNENRERISIRINDMKIKMDESEFREVAGKYIENKDNTRLLDN